MELSRRPIRDHRAGAGCHAIAPTGEQVLDCNPVLGTEVADEAIQGAAPHPRPGPGALRLLLPPSFEVNRKRWILDSAHQHVYPLPRDQRIRVEEAEE